MGSERRFFGLAGADADRLTRGERIAGRGRLIAGFARPAHLVDGGSGELQRWADLVHVQLHRGALLAGLGFPVVLPKPTGRHDARTLGQRLDDVLGELPPRDAAHPEGVAVAVLATVLVAEAGRGGDGEAAPGRAGRGEAHLRVAGEVAGDGHNGVHAVSFRSRDRGLVWLQVAEPVGGPRGGWYAKAGAIGSRVMRTTPGVSAHPDRRAAARPVPRRLGTKRREGGPAWREVWGGCAYPRLFLLFLGGSWGVGSHFSCQALEVDLRSRGRSAARGARC